MEKKVAAGGSRCIGACSGGWPKKNGQLHEGIGVLADWEIVDVIVAEFVEFRGSIAGERDGGKGFGEPFGF